MSAPQHSWGYVSRPCRRMPLSAAARSVSVGCAMTYAPESVANPFSRQASVPPVMLRTLR